MSQNIIKTITSKIDSLVDSAAHEYEELRQKQAEAQAAVNEARRRMDAATANADAAAYHTAKQDEAVASTSVEMYTQRITQITGRYLVSADENASTVAAIRAAQKKLEADATKQIIAHMKEIEKIGHAYYDNQDALNELLIRWHREIYKQPHRASPKLEVHPSDLRYTDDGLRSAIYHLVTLYFYRNKTGRTHYSGRGSIWK